MKALDQDGSLHIESRATSSWEHGNPVHQGTQKILRKYAVSFDSSKGSQQISQSDFEFFDLIVGMDESNVEDLLQVSAGRYDDKIKLFRPGGVPDPWYTGDFEETYNLIHYSPLTPKLLRNLLTYSLGYNCCYTPKS